METQRLVGTLVLNDGADCMFGRLKLGMLIVGCDWAVVVDAAAGLRTLNGDALLLFPNGVDFASRSESPVAITVILA